jgi:hypothetical protein
MATLDYIDTQASATFSTATNGAVSITTVGANEVLVVCFYAGQTNAGAPSGISVSSVSDTAGLTWAKRAALPWQRGDTRRNAIEVWWALKPTAGATTITVTANVTIDGACLGVVALKNLYNPASPWDTNASLPGSQAASGTTAPSVTVSTQQIPLVLAFGGAQQNTMTSSRTPVGFTSLLAIVNSTSVAFARELVSANAYGSPLSPQTVALDYSGATVTDAGLIVDAAVIALAPSSATIVTAVMN